jgi:hypothetical protein
MVHVKRIPYKMPAFTIDYFCVQDDVPKSESHRITFPIFYQCFFGFVRLKSVDFFRSEWDCMKNYCYEKIVTNIFIGKFDFVKDELHLKTIFPGAILLDRKEYQVWTTVNKHKHPYSVPFYQYGMALRNHAEETFLIRLNLDMTNTVYIECLVETQALSAKADFLLQHIQFVISE